MEKEIWRRSWWRPHICCCCGTGTSVRRLQGGKLVLYVVLFWLITSFVLIFLRSLLTLSVYLKITIIWNILNVLIKMWFWCLKLFQDGVWVTSLDYKNAYPDPLRDFAEKLVNEINTNNMEDVNRFCNIYVDLDFQVCTQLNVFCLYFYLKFVRNSNPNVT